MKINLKDDKSVIIFETSDQKIGDLMRRAIDSGADFTGSSIWGVDLTGANLAGNNLSSGDKAMILLCRALFSAAK
jgi:uncharacterized protein YjbI with pentapeptide repeats